MSAFLFLFFTACTPQTDPPSTEPELPQVWVASQPIEVGTPVTRDLLEQRRMAWLHPDTEPPSLEEIEGRVVRQHLMPGVPVRDERLALAEAGTRLSALIPNGMRAVTIPVTSVADLRPGHFVDVFTGTEGPDLTAATIVSVRPPSATQPPSVTLAVIPDQARSLSVPAARSLSLRSHVDITGIVEHGEITLGKADAAHLIEARPELAHRAVARRDLYLGVPILAEDLVAVPTPGWGPTLDVEEVVGRLPASRILAGEAIHPASLAIPEEGVGLDSIMPRGMHAIFLPVSGVQRAGIKPGDYVDLFASEAGEPVLLEQALFVMTTHPPTEHSPAQLGVLVVHSQAKTILRAGHQPETAFLAALRNPMDVQKLEFEEAD